ncbi:MAG: aminotransferase class I/II-fold pyridoxal phosphate-dependent enzyme [Clostridia bacterium]
MDSPGLKARLIEQYLKLTTQELKLDMSRGKPNKEQLDITAGLFNDIAVYFNRINKEKFDTGNYGLLQGIVEMKEIFSELLDVPPENIIVGGNSSLNLMYDMMSHLMLFGNQSSTQPWCREEKVRFLCPVPGYDRHFAICEFLGMELLPVPMTKTGPDMDLVEDIVSRDASVKGIWCVPKYSNPDGISYSDETIRRLASMDAMAKDFRIFCDNAYLVHHLYENDQDEILNILDECEKAGNPDRVYVFTSTSKISFPGSGISALAASPGNIRNILNRLQYQTIGYNKLNMLIHARALKNKKNIEGHMSALAEVLRPKFEIVIQAFEKELQDLDFCSWNAPKGGYFISFFTLEGCAKRTVALCEKAGVKMTPAGATHPYGKDPLDSNIRIAPTFPSDEELKKAMEVFCLCVRIAAMEKMNGEDWV